MLIFWLLSWSSFDSILPVKKSCNGDLFGGLLFWDIVFEEVWVDIDEVGEGFTDKEKIVYNGDSKARWYFEWKDDKDFVLLSQEKVLSRRGFIQRGRWAEVHISDKERRGWTFNREGGMRGWEGDVQDKYSSCETDFSGVYWRLWYLF